MPEELPNVSVSAAVPDKLVVNGCDLMNRDQLSSSQNRELQRYINANAHLLGFLDKEKDEQETDSNKPFTYRGGEYDTYSLDRYGRGAGRTEVDIGGGRADSQSLNRTGSPSSDYGGKRKGVSWSNVDVEVPVTPRARSHSPPYGGVLGANKRTYDGSQSSPYGEYGRGSGGADTVPYIGAQSGGDSQNGHATDRGAQLPPAARSYSPSYSTSDKRRTPHDYNPYGMARQSGSPWPTDSWSRSSRDRDNDSTRSGFKGFGRSDITAYTSLERHPDDYNRYDTHRFREYMMHRDGSRSQDRDEEVKFYGYGDHRNSGIEVKHKRWTGGEIITDPQYMKRAIKPRRLFYSPIGDGVVEADGIEMKRAPPDLTPRVSVRHERVVEQDRGRPGFRLIEKRWDEGERGPGDGDGIRVSDSRFPTDLGDLGGPRRKGPAGDGLGDDRGPHLGDGGKRAPSGLSDGGRGTPRDGSGPLGASPYEGLGGDGGPRPGSGLSIGTDGLPREGWTKTFIVNPRELINQYGTETNTNIFDLEDHTPKTLTTIKEKTIRESVTPVP